jgi:hypothetical protein
MTTDHWITLAKVFGAVLAAMITAGVPLLMYLHKIRREDMDKLEADAARRRDDLMNHVTKECFRLIRASMEQAAEEAGILETYVIRLMFATGFSVSAPLVRRQVMVDTSGASIALMQSDEEKTRYQLTAPAPYEIKTHSHPESEEVTVVYGMMEDLDTGKIYYPGDKWTIPPNTAHRVLFYSGTTVCIEVRPPLPLLRDVPLDLENLHLIGGGRP